MLGGDGLARGDGLAGDREGDVAVLTEGTHEAFDGPAGGLFDVVADRQRSEHDRQVSIDRLFLVVVDRAGFQIVFGHSERVFDMPQLVIRADHELW